MRTADSTKSALLIAIFTRFLTAGDIVIHRRCGSPDDLARSPTVLQDFRKRPMNRIWCLCDFCEMLSPKGENNGYVKSIETWTAHIEAARRRPGNSQASDSTVSCSVLPGGRER
jgi:hypothetical protein